MVEAIAGRGPLLGHHLQHGQKEVSEVTGVLVRPAILLHQHVKQGPRLQLGDVPQFTCRGAIGRGINDGHKRMWGGKRMAVIKGLVRQITKKHVFLLKDKVGDNI